MLRRGVHACPTGCSIGSLIDGGFQPSTRKPPTQRSAGCPAGNAADSADDTFDKPVSKTPVPARRPLRREALCLLANEVRPLAAEATREATPRIEYPAPAGGYGRMRRTRMMGPRMFLTSESPPPSPVVSAPGPRKKFKEREAVLYQLFVSEWLHVLQQKALMLTLQHRRCQLPSPGGASEPELISMHHGSSNLDFAHHREQG